MVSLAGGGGHYWRLGREVQHDLGQLVRVSPDGHRRGARLDLGDLDLRDALLARGHVGSPSVEGNLHRDQAYSLNQAVAALERGTGQLDVGDDAAAQKACRQELLVGSASDLTQYSHAAILRTGWQEVMSNRYSTSTA